MKLEFEVFNKKINLKKIIKISARIGLFLLILVSVYILNHSVLLSPDDYNYTFVQGTNMQVRVDSISNCIKTAKFFYNNWTGRVIPHVLIGIFRNINPIIFEIVNTFVFMLFIYLIPKILNQKSSFLVTLSVFGYLAFSMMFGEKFAWISGALNYLWPVTALLILMYFVYKYYVDEINLNKYQKIGLILSSFIIGFLHENTAFVGGSFLICLVLFKIKDFLKFDKNKKIVIGLIVVLFGLGALANIFAPGNFKRVNQVQSTFSWAFLENYKLNKGPIRTMLLSIIIVFFVKNMRLLKRADFNPFHISNLKKYDIHDIKIEILHFILPAIIATVPMAVIGYFPPRAFLAYELMFMIVLAKNVEIIADFIEEKNIISAIVSIALVLFIFGRFSPSTLAQIRYIIPYKYAITQEYEDALKRGEKDVLVTRFKYLPWIHVEDFINIHNFFPENDYKMPLNSLISKYYGFDRITAVGEDEYFIEIEVDTEGINTYDVIDIDTEENVIKMEYDNFIRYWIPKEKLGKYLLDGRENNIKDMVLNYSVRYVGGDLSKDEVSIDELILTN